MKKWLGDSPSRIIQDVVSQRALGMKRVRKKKIRGKKRIARRCEKLMQVMINDDIDLGIDVGYSFRSYHDKLRGPSCDDFLFSGHC